MSAASISFGDRPLAGGTQLRSLIQAVSARLAVGTTSAGVPFQGGVSSWTSELRRLSLSRLKQPFSNSRLANLSTNLTPEFEAAYQIEKSSVPRSMTA